MKSSALLAGLVVLAGSALADPTWPSDIDELEEIMFQLTSFRARKFADTVSPCGNEASGPGRQNAAEWLRTAFHDMSTANNYFGTGGLDASLQYELENGENTGPGHKTTLEFMTPFLSPRSSLSDLIAMGVYTSVRSCGGPIVPLRAGRKDASVKGNTGVPQPQNSVLTFQQQFDRMGFTTEEMIQVTACGHTIGGVHSDEFPDLVPADSVQNGEGKLDSSVAVFDNKVVTEYLSGNTTNPLVVGPSVQIGKNSDFKVFNSDNNVTMEALVDQQTFTDTCRVVLAKMIDVVPPGVELTDPIVPYMVKPVDLQLTLANGGSALMFSGYIRVKTTGLPEDSIETVSVTYKNRKGEAECGASSCTLTSGVHGVSQGFDDTFSFFPIEAMIPASSGISSFTVTLNNADGTTETYDNNGNEYPMQDAILFQKPQSCVRGSTGAFTVVAAVQNDRVADGASASITYKVPQDTSPAPLMKTDSVQLQKGDCVGKYTMFTADYVVDGGMAYQAYVDVTNGDKSDTFKSLTDVGGSCLAFANPAVCDGKVPGNSTASAPPTGTTTEVVSTMAPTTSAMNMTTVPPVTSAPPTTTTTTAGPAPTPQHIDTIGGYEMVSCWTEGNGTRALSGPSFANDTMTLEKCMDFCSEYVYWGTEYGRECYCGNSLSKSSMMAPLDACSFACAGNGSEFCGAGNRLELYSTTAAQPTTTTVAPTYTPVHKPTVTPYTLVGCWTEGQGTRALSQGETVDMDMTNEVCADFCEGFKYFGTEFGSECYCGSFLDETSESAPLADCNMPCAGDPPAGSTETEYCGGSNRLELYMNPAITGGDPEQPVAAGDFVLLGCQTEGNGTRALSGASTANDDMTNLVCAEFCADFEYFGTEYGRECYCGNTLALTSKEKPADECHALCAGDSGSYCGNANRLSTYVKKEETEETEG